MYWGGGPASATTGGFDFAPPRASVPRPSVHPQGPTSACSPCPAPALLTPYPPAPPAPPPQGQGARWVFLGVYPTSRDAAMSRDRVLLGTSPVQPHQGYALNLSIKSYTLGEVSGPLSGG